MIYSSALVALVDMDGYKLGIDEEVVSHFPGLKAYLVTVDDVIVCGGSRELEKLKMDVYRRIRSHYTLDRIKDDMIFRAYRDFYWRMGLDPTKVRPASEALVRRIVQGRSLPKINTVVDSYNLASALSKVPIAAFDADSISGYKLFMRSARPGEEFLGIGMREPRKLIGRELVVEDGAGLVAIYPYRDAERTKIAEDTKRVLLMICGAPGISDGVLEEAERITLEFIHGYSSRICSEAT